MIRVVRDSWTEAEFETLTPYLDPPTILDHYRHRIATLDAELRVQRMITDSLIRQVRGDERL